MNNQDRFNYLFVNRFTYIVLTCFMQVKTVKTVKTFKTVKTTVYRGLIDEKESKEMYKYIKKSVKWKNEIKSRGKNDTRKSCAYPFPTYNPENEDSTISQFIISVFCKLKLPDNLEHLGVYLNYYKNGNDFTPSHSHQGQLQVVISLGATRKLIISKKEYYLKSGDVIVFGSSVHSVPKESDVKRGRISIATFSKVLK